MPKKGNTGLLVRAENWFSGAEEKCIGGIIIFSSLLLFTNVIMRYLFHHAIYWAEELVRYLMVWLVFTGGSQVVKKEGHISVDLIHMALPQRYRNRLRLLVDLISFIFCLGLAYFSFEQMIRIRQFDQLSPALELPMWMVYLAIPLGSILMGLRYLVHLAAGLKKMMAP